MITGSRQSRDVLLVAGLLAYTAIVHTVDTLAASGADVFFDWTLLRWRLPSGFDLFKFLAWFVVPFVVLLSLGRIDWGYFGLRRWRRLDMVLLALLVGAGLGAVLTIQLVPGLQAWYPGMGHQPTSAKLDFALFNLAWTFSWIIGWEFLHRYALLTNLERLWPRYGWLAVPVIEGIYHLQKHPLEMLAMVGFSFVLTYWTRVRRNVMLPFLAHLAVEIELVAFLLVSG